MSSRFGGGCGGGFEAVFPGPLRRPFYLIYMVPVIRKLADASRNRQELTLGELAPYKFVWDFNTPCTPQWLEIDRELKCITGEGTVSANVLQIYNHASSPQSLLKGPRPQTRQCQGLTVPDALSRYGGRSCRGQ